MPKRRELMRVSLFVGIIATTIALRIFEATPTQAGMVAVSFAAVGLMLMFFWSTRNGNMTHCITYCPIGLMTNPLAKLNPFRLRIDPGCEECGVCSKHCRYGALDKKQIHVRRVGITCTLCGDCIASCKSNSLAYWFPLLDGSKARTVYLVLVVSVHAVFLGVARL